LKDYHLIETAKQQPIDGAGYNQGFTCFSAFDLPDNISDALREVLQNSAELVEGLPWYQGDHSLFLQNDCAAIAVSSQWFIENMECQEITHTSKENLNIVSYERVAECAIGIMKLIKSLL
jgi:aminopeptidase YwaD